MIQNCRDNEIVILTAEIPAEFSGKRVDQAAALLFPQYSRMRLQSWIRAGQLTVDGKPLLPKEKIAAGQIIKIDAVIEAQADWKGQDLGKLNIAYEDQDIIIVDKPVGLVVHPAVGNRDHTLLNALLFYAPELAKVPRAGIIHRLDKGTSGLMVVARNLISYNRLNRELKKREIGREYEAIVSGIMISGGEVNAPIGRHPTKRTLMAVVDGGKPALTHYRIIQRFRAHTHIRVKLDTGRTHQIRVHMAFIGYPLVGDKSYNNRAGFSKGMSEGLKAGINCLKRQALHACELTLRHPHTKKIMSFTSPLPKDMQDLLKILKKDSE